MDFNDSLKPRLVENGVKYFLNQTLKQCHIIRETYYNQIYNFCLFGVFLLILGLILLYKYKGRLTQSEKQEKDRVKQQYILSKMKQLQEAKKKAHQELITGLPNWESEFDIVHNKMMYS